MPGVHPKRGLIRGKACGVRPRGTKWGSVLREYLGLLPLILVGGKNTGEVELVKFAQLFVEAGFGIAGEAFADRARINARLVERVL